MKYQYSDGGRAEAGYKGNANDCAVRAIAIATGKPYQEVYNDLNSLVKAKLNSDRLGKESVRNGTPLPIIREYLKSLGWQWIPTMHIGSGCKVHLIDSELPAGRVIVRLSKHITCVIDKIIYDTYDPQRSTIIVENGVQRIAGRCVYGYWIKD